MTILRYHEYSNWKILKLETDDLEKEFTFGFELEVTSKNDGTSSSIQSLVNDIKRRSNIFIFERDGSIGNGVEIISQPMTWNYFINNLSVFKQLLSICESHNFNSHNGNLCGLHVHVGRKALNGIDHIGNKINQKIVIQNINFILERFQNELFKFSRRTYNSLERWSDFYTETITLENGSKFIDKDTIKNISDGGRYHALNLTNEKTIEFRFLRGTLKWKTFFLSMNLLKNIVEESRISDNTVTFKKLILNGLNEKESKWAKDYCIERNIDLENKESNTIIALNQTYQIIKPLLENEIETLINDIESGE